MLLLLFFFSPLARTRPSGTIRQLFQRRRVAAALHRHCAVAVHRLPSSSTAARVVNTSVLLARFCAVCAVSARRCALHRPLRSWTIAVGASATTAGTLSVPTTPGSISAAKADQARICAVAVVPAVVSRQDAVSTTALPLLRCRCRCPPPFFLCHRLSTTTAAADRSTAAAACWVRSLQCRRPAGCCQAAGC